MKFFGFKGGVHPPENKIQTENYSFNFRAYCCLRFPEHPSKRTEPYFNSRLFLCTGKISEIL